MSNYTKTTNFATKDSLPSGNANKIVKGTEIDTEFNNIATAVATKADTAGPTFTGTVTIPTADINGGAVDGTTIGAASASSIVGTTIVANTSINIAGDGATVTGIKDEDDMSSNSATKLATQQSIKAYVDSQLTAQDLDVTDGSSSIDIDLDSESLGILGGTGIDSTASGTGVTLAIDSTVATLTGSQTLTNKTLTAPTLTGTAVVASLDISGDVDVDGTLETDALSINSTTVTSTAAELNILDGVTATASELNILDGVTSTTAELNILDGVTSTAAELNILDGVTSTTAELNILDGVTSTTAELNILDGVTATASELNIMDGVTASTAELNIMDGVTSTTAELNILDGVTSTAAELNILDGKAFLDEDDMSSNSATGIASQQSIKAYVDAQITAEDLDFQADSGGALSIDLDSETLTFTGGTGIDTSGSGNAVTFAIDSTVATLTGSQTLTNKTLTSPDINTPDIDGGTIDNTVIGGSTAAAGSFTTGAFSGNVSLTGSGNTAVLINTGNNSGDNSQIKFGDSADDDVGQINYDHGTNAMQFRTNGAANTLILDNGGRVGIKTSPINSALYVGYGGGFAGQLLVEGGSGSTYVGIGHGTDSPALHWQTGDFRFATSTASDLTGFSEKMRIMSTGKVLIGDTASHTTDLLQIETPASGGGHGIQIRRNDSNSDQGVGRVMFGNNTDSELASVSAKTDGATDSGALLFNTSATGGSLTERVRISASEMVVNEQSNDFDFRCETNAQTHAFHVNAGAELISMTVPLVVGDVIASGSGGLSLQTSDGQKRIFIDDANGNVGVGATNPTSRLHVKTSSNVVQHLESTATQGGYINLSIGAGGATLGFIGSAYEIITSASSSDLGIRAQGELVFATNGSTERARIHTDGKFEMTGTSSFIHQLTGSSYAWLAGTDNNRYNFYTADGNLRGYLTASGVFTDTSDIAYKKEIQDLSYGLAEVKQMQPRAYKMKINDEDQLGFIAQEMEQIIPEVVSGENGSKGLAYGHLVPVLVKAIQEQQTLIESLTDRIAALEQ